MKLAWIKCMGGHWCELLTVNLRHSHFDNLDGVYIIWHGGNEPATVYVGKGRIVERLKEHRVSAQILQYAPLDLFVSWARVDISFQDGVERYLADILKPKVGKKYPVASTIAVNLPWSEE